MGQSVLICLSDYDPQEPLQDTPVLQGGILTGCLWWGPYILVNVYYL